MRGWAPGADGRVHPNFGFKPATGQLSSDNPNAQNFPAHGALALSMKKMLVTQYVPDGETMWHLPEGIDLDKYRSSESESA